jgi:hypothetical protein
MIRDKMDNDTVTKYRSWTLVQLKNELKTRGIETSGRKKEFFDR